MFAAGFEPLVDLIRRARRFRMPRRRQAGQSAVEFALIAPAMVLVFVIGADVARAFSTVSVLANAARAGAQYGGQNRSTAADSGGMRTAARNDANGLAGFDSSATTFCLCNGATVSCSTAAGCVSNLQLYVKVTATASFSTMLPYPGIARTLQLQGSSTILVP